MKILHITDFHYKKNNSQKEKIIESIINTIIDKSIKIDLVLFTGDLVFSGTQYSDFTEAEEILIEPIINKLNVQKQNVIFCPGNHDIDRQSVHSAMEAYIERNINSDTELDQFHKANDVYNDSLKPLENYKKFIHNYYGTIDPKEDIISDLYSIHYRIIDDKRIGIVSLSSAWLSSTDKDKNGKKDKGNLLIPIHLLSEIRKSINSNNVQKKIIIIHHPLYFLKEFNIYSVENAIHNNFDMMFSGHIHKSSSISRYSGTNGIFEHISKASLSSNETLGCSIVELNDIEENIINVEELTYIDDDILCHISEPIIYTIPCGSEKLEIISFRRKLFDKIEIEKENANNLLLLTDKDDNNDFLTLYKSPILKKEPEDSLESKTAPIISIDDMLLSKTNFVVLGKDKCGKSSLLRKIQLDCLINYSRNSIIPFFFDCKELNSIENVEDIEYSIRTYFGISKSKTENVLSSNNFILLLDNYSSYSTFAIIIDEFLFKYTNIRFIACTEFNLSTQMEIFDFGGLPYEKLYHYDLRRQEIIAYTDKRLSSNSKKVEIQNKIIQLCKQLELPLNYWTVSLLLLIYNKSSDSYSKNLFSILDVCVDEIFGKKRILLSNCKISFDQLKNICARLAKFLFKKHSETIYSAQYSIILKFIEDEIKTMLRVSANGRDILDFYISCGMLKNKSNDFLVFRLNGFFEYFLAYQMTKDEEFKTEIISDDKKYLAFKNQLEIYSGFKRDDSSLLDIVFEKTRNKIDIVLNKYDKNEKDIELQEKVQISQDVEQFCRETSIKRTLSTIEIAEIEDITNELDINADVHLIKEVDLNIINSEVLERYLSILSRVFKNLDEVNKTEEDISSIFNYILDSYCNFGFFIIDEFSLATRKEIEEELEIDLDNFPELDLLKFISGFSPIISQNWLSDGMGHSSLEKIIKSEINKLELNSSQNQYKLFLLYFLLLDIDLKSNRQYIEIALKNIKIPVLKYAIYFKLNFYLVFKSGDDKLLQQELSNNIQRAQLNIDNKTKVSGIQKKLQEKRAIASKKKLFE